MISSGDFSSNMHFVKHTCTALIRRNNLTFARCLSTNLNVNKDNNYDIVVVGGGIVGVATARELKLRHEGLRMAILEKEEKLAAHQSGHNSGVVHAGIYYTPGSLKAKLCVEGMQLAYEYFEKHNVPYKKVGKLIVATNETEVAQLDKLFDRALQNKVSGVELLGDARQIREIEPHCVGKKAIWSPETGIVDWGQVTNFYGHDFQSMGGNVYLKCETIGFEKIEGETDYPVRVINRSGQPINARYVLTCAGLQSDLVAQMSSVGGVRSPPRIIPFRGEYLLLRPEKRHLIRGNIYPVPDPRFPFLGVHFTPRMNGDVWLGPNAVLAFKREGYKLTDFQLTEFLDAVRYPGFQRLAAKYALAGAGEMLRSVITQLQVRQLQRFVPELRPDDVTAGPAGVRAQALDESGQLVDDFRFDVGGVGAKGVANRLTDFQLTEFLDAVRYPGFQRLAAKYALAGAGEMLRSVITQLQVRQLQRFVPELRPDDVTAGPAGVRAQALDESGQLVDDFRFDVGGVGAKGVANRILHCRNAPSPGATSALAIAKMMADRMQEQFQLE